MPCHPSRHFLIASDQQATALLSCTTYNPIGKLFMAGYSCKRGLQCEEQFVHVKASSQANSGGISEGFGFPIPVEMCNVFGQRSTAWRL